MPISSRQRRPHSLTQALTAPRCPSPGSPKGPAVLSHAQLLGWAQTCLACPKNGPQDGDTRWPGSDAGHSVSQGGRTRRLAVAAGCQAPRPGPDGGPVDEDRRMAVIRFRAQLRAAARPPRSRPATPSGGRGRRRHTIPVVATVNGDTWQTSVARIGGVFLAGLNREVRGGAGGQAGDGAEVTIGLDGRRARSRCPRFWRRPSPLTRDRLHPSSRRPSPTASSTPAGSLKPGQNNPATARGPGPGDDPGRKGPLLPSPPPRLLSLSYRFAPGRGSPLAPNDHSGVARLDRDHIPPAVR
jgi:hypothetical protein